MQQLVSLFRRSTQISLLCLLLAGCVASPLKPPSGSALTPQSAQAYLDDSSALLEQEDDPLTLSDPQGLAMRLHYAAQMLAQPDIKAALLPAAQADAKAPDEARGILSASLLNPAKLLNLGQEAQVPGQSLQRYVEALRRLMAQPPRYEKATFGPKLTLLANSNRRSSERLWDLAAQNLATIPTPEAAATLVSVAATQLERADFSAYAQALIQQQPAIIALPDIHRQLASALLDHWQQSFQALSEQPEQARWGNALHQQFLGIAQLSNFWPELSSDASQHSALLQLVNRRLAELQGDSHGQREPLRALRQQISQLPLSDARQHSLGRFFPVAYFRSEAGQHIQASDHDAMGRLIIALRLMELAAPDTSAEAKSQLLATLQLGNYRPFQPAALGIAVPAARQQISPLLRTYLNLEPGNSGAQQAWIRNVSLLMQGRPQDICPRDSSHSEAPRPSRTLACAQVLGQQWHSGWSARLYDHLVIHRDSFTAEFYNPLMASLSPAINAGNAAAWLELQHRLIEQGSKPRAAVILPWSSLALHARTEWPEQQPRKLAQAALTLGLSPDSPGMTPLLLQTPLPWLLERAVLQQAPQLPTSLIDRLVQQHSQVLDATQRARFLPPLLQQVRAAPDAEALPAARLARLLAQDDTTVQAKVDQAIRSRWLQ